MSSTSPPRVMLARGAPRRPMSCWGKGGIVCGVVALLLLVGFIYVWQQFTYVPPEARTAPAGGRSANVEQARKDLAEAVKRAQAGVSSEVSVRLTEDDVNAYLREHARELPPEAPREPRVRFLDRLVELGGFVQLAGREAYVTIQGLPSATADGRLAVEITEARAGRLGLPGSLVQKAQAELEKALARGDMQKVQVKTVEVRAGELSATGQVAPRS